MSSRSARGAVPRARRPRRVAGAVLASVLGLLLGALPAHSQEAVAVLYFDNSGNPELEMLKVGLAQMLTSDLHGTPGVTVVERARLQAVLDEHQIQRGDLADPAAAVRVGRLLGARRLVLGAYFELLGTLRIDARVVEVETSRVLASAGVGGPRERFLSLQAELADRLRAALAPGPAPDGSPAPTRGGPEGPVPSPAGAPRAPAGSPPQGGSRSLEAALTFSEGLGHLDRKDLVRAREALSRALDLDPGLEDARALLAGMGP